MKKFVYLGNARSPMGKLDLVLVLVFGCLALVSLAAAILCFLKALRVAGEKNGDLKMFGWAVGTMFALIVAGAAGGYILLPILLHR
jgi:hypothetical protein